MKKISFPTLGAVLALGAASVVGYALINDPAPVRSAAITSPAPIPAESGEALPCEHGRAVSASGNEERQATRDETQGSVAFESARAIQPAAPTARFEPASAGMASLPQDSVQPGATTSSQSRPASSGAVAGADTTPATVLVPLAFLPVPPELAASNPQMVEAMQGLQQDFVNAVGKQNPNDPQYYQRWTDAQPKVDEKYRLLVGNQAFLIEQQSINNQ